MRPFSVVVVVFICIVAYSQRFVKVKAKWKFLKSGLTFLSICAMIKMQMFCNRMEMEE